MRHLKLFALLLAPPFAALLAPHLPSQDRGPARSIPRFLHPCRGGAAAKNALCGTFKVWEDRAAKKGRRIGLNVVVLRAWNETPKPDPVFFLAGGPGQAATSLAGRFVKHWMRRDRDIVLVDQRGTGKSNPLHVRLPGSADDPSGYLRDLFDVEVFRRARRELGKRADLTKYTTPIAADDLDDLRAALGYGKINLVGGSYGTRAALVYIRRHPGTVRSAILTGVAPITFKNPLYHAQAAQEGFEVLLAECRADPRYEVYHDLDEQLATVLRRLGKAPAKVVVRHPRTGRNVTVRLTRDRFAEALRVRMYFMAGNRTVPLLIHRAFHGDYAPVAQACIARNGGLRSTLAFGMLMCVVGSEDIPRIREAEIGKATRGTFLGDARVRQQMAVAKVWPRGDVPEDYGEPVRGDMPVLFVSGTHDPVTPPRWGAEAARHFPNGLHVVVPAAHGTSDPKVEKLKRRFLDAGSVTGLDLSVLDGMALPALKLPGQRVVR